MNDQSSRHETRGRIVEAARELFFAQGYASTGIAQILKHSGANSGSLYHFFPTKEELLIAVLEKYKSMLEPMVLGPAYERASDPIDRLFAVLDGYRRLLEATDFNLGCPIGNLALETSNSYPQVRILIIENFEAWRCAIQALIEASAERFPLDVRSEEVAHFVLATMEGAVMLARAYHSFEPFDSAISTLRDYFDRLIADGSDWSQPRNSTQKGRKP